MKSEKFHALIIRLEKLNYGPILDPFAPKTQNKIIFKKIKLSDFRLCDTPMSRQLF